MLIYVCHFHHYHQGTFLSNHGLSRYSCLHLGSLHPSVKCKAYLWNTQNVNESIIVLTCALINYTYHTFTTAKYLLSTFSPIIFQIESAMHNVFLGLLLLHVNQTWYVWTRVGNKSKLLFYLCVCQMSTLQTREMCAIFLCKWHLFWNSERFVFLEIMDMPR